MMRRQTIAGLITGLLAAGNALAAPVAEQCSANLGVAVINELKSKGGGVAPKVEFAEVKILGTDVDVAGWTLCYTDNPGKIEECVTLGAGKGTWHFSGAQGDDDDGPDAANPTTYQAGTYLVYSIKNLKANDGEILLRESPAVTGKVLDYVRYGKDPDMCDASHPDFLNKYWAVPAACGACIDDRDPDQKDFARLPDGTGDWSNNGDSPTEGDTNDPLPSNPDHFAISHDGSGINCQAEPVVITAHDASEGLFSGYTGTISLSTSTGRGDWTLISGSGTLVNNGSGSGSYAFAAGDGSTVTLGLKNSFVESLSINVSDSGISEAAAEDPLLAFAQSGFNVLADGVNNSIATQIASKSSNASPGSQVIELQAIDTNSETGVCEAALVGSVDIPLAFECRDPGSCAASQLMVNGTPVAANAAGSVSSYTPVGLDFGDATDGTATLVLNYPDAGKLRLHAQYDIPLGSGAPSGNLMSGASNEFVVRPFGFLVQAVGNPGAADETGAIYRKAGEAFDVTLTAKGWQSADDVDADGVPDVGADLSTNATLANFGQETVPATVDLDPAVVQPAGGSDGALGGGAGLGGFAGGASTNSVSWSEVGIVELSAELTSQNYLNSGANVTGTSSNIGRFTPDHFCLDTPLVVNRTDAATLPACGDTFSYLDESFAVTFALRAQALGDLCTDPVALTQNYGGVWAKFTQPFAVDPAAMGAWNLAAVNDPAGTPVDLSGRLNVQSILENSVPANPGFVNGTANLRADLRIQRQGVAPAYTAEAPLLDARVGVAPVDGDGVSLEATALNLAIGAGNFADLGSTQLYYGRVIGESAVGSDQLPLPMSARLQVCTSIAGGQCATWQDQVGDTCSQFGVAPPGDTALGNAAAGDGAGYWLGNLDFSGTSGEVIINATGGWNLWYTGSGSGGIFSVPFAAHSYLLTAPGSAAFGTFRGNDRIIYWQERF